MTYKYELTKEHRKKLPPLANKWIKNALRTGLYTNREVKVLTGAIKGLYKAANLTAPGNRVICYGPITGAIASGVAAGIWYLRKNPDKQKKLFGRLFSESELMGAVPITCATVVVVDLPDSPGEKFLRVTCGTGRQFCLPVPREMTTARQANAWTYGLRAEELQVEVRT